MTKITLLGLGAMGSRMGLRLLAAGYGLTVWNRTPARADALLENGARWAETPRAAAEGAGAAVKLSANGLFGARLSALAELLGFLRGAGVDPARALAALAETPVLSPAAKGAGGAMLAGNFAPAFPIVLVAKDFRLLADTAASQASPLPIMAGVQAVLAEAMARGLGDLNVTGMARLYD